MNEKERRIQPHEFAVVFVVVLVIGFVLYAIGMPRVETPKPAKSEPQWELLAEGVYKDSEIVHGAFYRINTKITFKEKGKYVVIGKGASVNAKKGDYIKVWKRGLIPEYWIQVVPSPVEESK